MFMSKCSWAHISAGPQPPDIFRGGILVTWCCTQQINIFLKVGVDFSIGGSIGVGAGNFLGVLGICWPNFPKFSQRLFCDKRSPYRFSVVVGTCYFPLPCCHRLESRAFGTWNLVLYNPTEKSTLGCARTLSEATWISTLSICFTYLRFGVPFAFQLLLSASKITPSRGNICNILYGKMCSSKHRPYNWKHSFCVLAWHGLY